MATKQFNARMRIKTDTASNWASNNPTLLAGEVAFVSDSNVVKIGDGTTAFSSLDTITPMPLTDDEIIAILEE